jgi:hypothetical protein
VVGAQIGLEAPEPSGRAKTEKACFVEGRDGRIWKAARRIGLRCVCPKHGKDLLGLGEELASEQLVVASEILA